MAGNLGRGVNLLTPPLTANSFSTEIIATVTFSFMLKLAATDGSGSPMVPITVSPTRIADGFLAMQKRVADGAAHESGNVSLWEWLIPSIDLRNAVFQADFGYEYAQKTGDFNLDVRLGAQDVVWESELLSTEPAQLDGSVSFSAHVNIPQKEFSLSNVKVETHGAESHFDEEIRLPGQGEEPPA